MVFDLVRLLLLKSLVAFLEVALWMALQTQWMPDESQMTQHLCGNTSNIYGGAFDPSEDLIQRFKHDLEKHRPQFCAHMLARQQRLAPTIDQTRFGDSGYNAGYASDTRSRFGPAYESCFASHNPVAPAPSDIQPSNEMATQTPDFLHRRGDGLDWSIFTDSSGPSRDSFGFSTSGRNSPGYRKFI